MRLNGIIGAEIPYYKMMNKAMPGPAKDTKRKPKNGRLTEIDPKTNKPRLKSGVPISRNENSNNSNLNYRCRGSSIIFSSTHYYVFLLCIWY